MITHRGWFIRRRFVAVVLFSSLVGFLSFGGGFLRAQSKQPVWTAEEKPVADQIAGLRGLPDDFRGRMTQDLAIRIRHLPVTENKLRLA
jgi:hypothetical protein